MEGRLTNQNGLFIGMGRNALSCVSTWMDFGGNTRNLDSIWEERDKIATLHEETQKLSTDCGDGVRISGDGVRNSSDAVRI
nr:hypothetical protein [Tanacetum cinerariifolium]